MEPAWIGACDSAACVEVQDIGTVVKIRDSKDPDGPVLNFTTEEWHNFKEGIRNGAFD